MKTLSISQKTGSLPLGGLNIAIGLGSACLLGAIGASVAQQLFPQNLTAGAVGCTAALGALCFGLSKRNKWGVVVPAKYAALVTATAVPAAIAIAHTV